MMRDEELMMKDDDFKLLKGFGGRQADICNCRVAFETENTYQIKISNKQILINMICYIVCDNF